MDSQRRIAGLLTIASLGALILACNGGVKDVYAPKELHALCKKAGFVPLPFPDSAYEAGAIISMSESGVPRYVDHLRSCEYPPELLIPVKGETGEIIWKGNRDFSATALLELKGVEAGPEYKSVSKNTLHVEAQSADKLSLLKIKAWENKDDNYQKIPPVCRETFEKSNVYVILEALRPKKAKYTLLNKDNAAIKLTGANLGKFLKLEPEVSYDFSSDGALIIEEPVTICVRNVTWFGSGYELPGAGPKEEKTADSLLEKYYLETSGR